MTRIISNSLIIENVYGVFTFFRTLNYDMLTRFNFSNYHMLPKITKIIFTITLVSGLKNETDIKIVNALSILDYLLWKKAEVDTLLQKYLRKSKNIIFVARSTLNNKFDIYLFFFLILKIVKPSLKRRYITLKVKVLQDGFIFYISDISSVAEIPEDLKKDRVSIKVSVYFNKYIKKYLILYILSYLGFQKKL